MKTSRLQGRVQLTTSWLLLLSVACSGSGVTDNVRVASIDVTPEQLTVAVGAIAPLAAEVRDASGAVVGSQSLFWSSSDSTVVKVSPVGVVTGLKVGEATVAATVQGVSATAAVIVSPRSVATVRIAPNPAAVRVGATRQLSVQTLDASGDELTGRPVTWESSNSNIASVDASGLVTGKLPGAVTITASSEGRSGTAALTVSLVPVAAVTVAPANFDMRVGETSQLTATPRDEQGSLLNGRIVSWSSSSSSVATVSSSGLVTAITPGTVTITATSEGQSGTAVISVLPRAVNSVSVSPNNTSVAQGTTTALSATLRDILGNILSGRDITWTSSNNSIASVSATGVVTGVTPGDATVTATSEGKSGVATVRVTPVAVASVNVAPASPTIFVGQNTTLVATPRSASGQALSGRAVTWTSGSPGIATVDGSGVVTGVSPGTALVFAVSEGVTGSASVTVQRRPVVSVTITPANPNIAVLQSRQLEAAAWDSDGNALEGRSATWSSSDDTIAFVTSGGLVIGLRKGTATITALVEGVTGTTTVTVN